MDYRILTNDDSTIGVSIWDDGTVTVAQREHSGDTWGPPVTVTESEANRAYRVVSSELEGDERDPADPLSWPKGSLGRRVAEELQARQPGEGKAEGAMGHVQPVCGTGPVDPTPALSDLERRVLSALQSGPGRLAFLELVVDAGDLRAVLAGMKRSGWVTYANGAYTITDAGRAVREQWIAQRDRCQS